MRVKKIDIHVHTAPEKGCPRLDGTDYATPDELRAIYDEIGVERGVILPSNNPECAVHLISNEDVEGICARYPDSFAWFCNLHPRALSNSPDADLSHIINHYKSRGAKGVGELCCNMYFDDPMVLNLFRHCQDCEMPVTFHIGDLGGDYGLVDEPGLPRLEKVLAMFPKLRFLGHSQKFWAEISGDCTEAMRGGYPTGKVVPGGRVVELMRKYPNLCGDLSAGSGCNAMMRDPEFAYRFFEEFSDRLYYGTDICAPENSSSPMLRLSAFLDEAVDNGHISEETYYKISRGNALALLKD